MKTKVFETVVKVVLIATLAITLVGLSSAYIPEINSFIDGIMKHENLYLAAASGLLVSLLIDLLIKPPPETRYS